VAPSSKRVVHIGLISDTHGLVRPEAIQALRGVDSILHAGDIGGPTILEQLRDVAPVFAVRGNNDRDDWARQVPERKVVIVGAIRIYLLHNLNEIDIDPAAAGFNVVVTGHSHRPSVVVRGGVLYVNPGSAGPRRFRLPVSVARLRVRGPRISATLVELAV
jgi:putative phosphoesterase